MRPTPLGARYTRNRERLTFVELCSGRGCLSMLLAHTYPDANIHMCDSDGRMKVPHLSHPSMRNVSFHLEDMFHDDAARTVRTRSTVHT
jgi:tRNA1(Val) A37 N6-methylase TrmN6